MLDEQGDRSISTKVASRHPLKDAYPSPLLDFPPPLYCLSSFRDRELKQKPGYSDPIPFYRIAYTRQFFPRIFLFIYQSLPFTCRVSYDVKARRLNSSTSS